MNGTIANFRSSRHHQKGDQMIVVAEGVDDKAKAEKLVGRTVRWESPAKKEAKKEIKGKITAAHGNKGAFRVTFEKGMPGQSISSKVKID